MNSNIILLIIFGLTLAENNSINNNKTSIVTISQTSNDTQLVLPQVVYENSVEDTNQTAIEFFGAEEPPVPENNTYNSVNQIIGHNTDKNLTKLESNNKNNTKSVAKRRFRLRTPDRKDGDPLMRNEQRNANPFRTAPGLNGGQGAAGGGLDPQLAQLLQNPRIRQLAEQNPEIAQQIIRNPRLLRDPRIASLIRAQLGEGGGGGGLLGLLPGALQSAFNPLGLGLGGGGGQQRPFGGNSGGLGGQQRGGGNGGGGGGGLFGAPRGAQQRPFNRNRNNEENIGGGYYGNNQNYGNNNKNNQNNNNQNTDQNAGNGEDTTEGTNEGDGQDYDNAGEGGQEGEGGEGEQDGGQEEGAQEAQDPSQDPANDPDIQQLQNLGGGSNDDFPASLFPPGLLSKEDLDEIRKQQQKQAKEQADREKQQQQAQNGGGQAGGGGGQGQDYDYGNGGEGDGTEGAEEGAEETPDEGTGGEDTTAEPEEEVVTAQPTPAPKPVYRNQKPNQNRNQRYRPEIGGLRQSSDRNPGVEYDEILDVNTPTATPPTVNSIRAKGGAKKSQLPQAIPVPHIPYKPQQGVQGYPQPIPGVYQQPVVPQVYGQQPQYQQPIQYYPQYQPQYVPQQYLPQQQQYPQQYIPQQQYVGQQPNQYIQPQIYQPIPVQQAGYPQQQQLLNQPIYPAQYGQNPNIRGQQQLYKNNRGGQTDPNLANHNLNTVPHDDSEDSSDGYDDPNSTDSPQFGFGGQTGRSFQQQPRLFSSSAAQNTESSVAFNSTEPSILNTNKFNENNNKNHNYNDNNNTTNTYRIGF